MFFLKPGPPPTPTKTPKPIPTQTLTVVKANLLNLETPTPTPTPITEFCPLTGEPVDNPEKINRRPLAVKIANSPEVRPQSGLSFADIVFEHLAEGGLTRFTAIFLCKEAERIGSIRSARLIDLEIPLFYQAIFAYSGASGEITRMLDNCDFAQYTLSEWRGDPGFFRIKEPGKAFEHTLFTSTTSLWKVATQRGINQKVDINHMVFAKDPPPHGLPANEISIPYHRKYSDVFYRYDPRKEAYLRFIAGEPHLDALTGEQIAVKNVVIVYVHHVETLIVEDVLGAKSVQIQLWGQGKAQVCRDGRVYDAIWSRPSRPDPLKILDYGGNIFPFKPGNTWFELVPLDMEVKIK
ncbi:MAG: DUF3048 domain-containing protein [Anaerolineae bacterium]|nr:DUF3048 domain-containing protein [Anaerolineae bacterium]